VRGGFDLISANLAAGGPIGERVGFAVSSRSLHDYGAPILGGGHTPYGYRDALGRVDVQLGDGHRLSATVFWNEESVLLNMSPGESDPGASFVVPEDASWGNHALVLSYHGALAQVGLDATISTSGYQAQLPLRPSQDGPTTPAENDGLLANANTRRLRLSLDASAPFGASRLRFGVGLDHTDILYSASRFEDVGTGTGVEMKADGLSAGVYVDGVRNLARGLDLRLGVRADAFSRDGGIRFAPRIALLWSLTDQALLTVAAGRYHQFSRALDEQVDLAVSEGPLATSVETLLSVATADHLAVSLDQQLNDRIRVDIEGFWKVFNGLGGPGADPLQNSGVDLQVLHESEQLTAWVGYNLSWFWSGESGTTGTSNFMGRQLLSAGLRGSISGRTGGSITLGYSAGLPYTSIPYETQDGLGTVRATGAALSADVAQEDPMFSGGEPDDGFLRLDIELFTRFTANIGGHAFEVRPYLRLINALDQRDALFYYFEPWRDANLRPLAERSLLPVFGVEWRF